MLQEQFTSVLQAKTPDALLTEVVKFAHHLEFETVNAMAVVDGVNSEPDFIGVDNTPAAYVETFCRQDSGRHDPVMQHCKRASLPIIWNQDTYTTIGQGERWEFQARHGHRTGIALAMHLPGGLHFCIGVNRDQALPANSDEVTRMAADLQLFAVHAQDAAMHVLLPPCPQREIPRLTPRELESLRWTMEGKTAWELGVILGISEQTAARHVHNATQKLGCVNKLQAVLKALRLKLIG